MTLRFLAAEDCITSLAFAYRRGRSTVCEIYCETDNALWTSLNEIVLKTLNTDSWKTIAYDFADLWQLPNCCGALAGRHIGTECSNKSGTMYFNYKMFCSVVLFAVCGAHYNFVYINIGSYGPDSGSGILRNSLCGHHLKNGTLNLANNSNLPGTNISFPFFFFGYEAFPLPINLLRPYSGSFLSEDKQICNCRLSRARMCIENSCGVLTARWKIFQNVINAHQNSVDAIVKAAVCLHNFAKLNEMHQPRAKRKYCNNSFVDSELSNGEVVLHEWRNMVSNITFIQLSTLSQRIGSRNATRNAFHNIDILKDYLNGTGTVDW